MHYSFTTHAHVRRVRNHANHSTLSTHTRVHAFAIRWRACLTASTRAFALGKHFYSVSAIDHVIRDNP
eukprot:4076755-Pleurochrysis_carterae.AAC.2